MRPGGVSVASLFMAGYLPGILMGLSIMLVCGCIAKRRGISTFDGGISRPVMQDETFTAVEKVGS
jgi:TRAP-type C4-dicarboxylate transport system permease large subunit